MNAEEALINWVAKEGRATLDQIERNLRKEYESDFLSAAERLTALSEMRKIVHLRALIHGLIEPTAAAGRKRRKESKRGDVLGAHNA
jgi:hypothetical protein